MSAIVLESDGFDVRAVRSCPDLLRAFNSAGVLAPADVHVAMRLATLADEHEIEMAEKQRRAEGRTP